VRKLDKYDLELYLKDIKKRIYTFEDAKKASILKWRKIYEVKDELDWSGGLRSVIWTECGLCVYFSKGQNGCEDCPLPPNCCQSYERLNDVPLKRIMIKVDKGEKPEASDLLDFLKTLENLEYEEKKPVVEVGDRIKSRGFISSMYNDSIVTRIEGQQIHCKLKDGSNDWFNIAHIERHPEIVDNTIREGDIVEQDVTSLLCGEDPVAKVIRIEGDKVYHQHLGCSDVMYNPLRTFKLSAAKWEEEDEIVIQKRELGKVGIKIFSKDHKDVTIGIPAIVIEGYFRGNKEEVCVGKSIPKLKEAIKRVEAM
jgi:hypothetical protein